MKGNHSRSTPRFNKIVTIALAVLTLIFVSLSVFLALIMIGTNTPARRILDQTKHSYSAMADKYVSTFPECKIIFLSILPVSAISEQGSRTNENIRVFNSFIQSIAEQYGATYVDLFPLYESDGALNPNYTNDGLHITPDSYTLWVNAISKSV